MLSPMLHPIQQVDALKRQRGRYLEELKEVTIVRRKEPELQTLQHQIATLENRLSFSKKDREVTVSDYTCIYMYMYNYIYIYIICTCTC